MLKEIELTIAELTEKYYNNTTEELAKELGVNKRELIKTIKKCGITPKTNEYRVFKKRRCNKIKIID
jgi:hypothetical protein